MDAEFDPWTGVLTITGIATAYEYEDVLRSIVFVDLAGYRTPGDIEVTFNLFDGLTFNEIDTLTLTIESAPYITEALDNVLIYDQGRELEMIGAGLDVEFESSITGAVVSISDGYQPDQDILTFTDQNGITGAFDVATGTLTLSGTASTENYEASLASIGYRNTRFNPVAGNRIVTFQVMAGSATSNESLALISVEPIIVPPEVVVGANVAYQEGGAPVNIAPELSIASKDATSPFLSSPETLYGAEIQIVNYVAGEDVLSFIAADNITGEFDDVEGRLVLIGESSYDEYEAVIRSITYFNASEVPTTTTREFKIRLLESGANGMANQTITTQIVVGLPDPVSLLSGAADDIRVLQNEDFVLLGLEDLVYSSPAVSEFSVGLTELRFTVSKLPLASLGQIVFEDGTDLELNKPYPISQLAGLRFEPTLGATGSSEFTYTIAVADSDSGNIETSGLTDTLSISVEGIVTNSPEQAFIAQAYRDLLNRNIDQATLTLLTTNLEEKLKRVDRSKGFESEADARESLLGELVGTEAYRTELIQGLYQSLMLRAATSEELATRIADLANGVQLDDVRLLLTASEEYFELHNENGFESYLDAVYEALLDRKPTATERADGVVRLQKGQPLLDAVKAIGSWASLSQSDQRSLITDLLNRDYEFDDHLILIFQVANR